MVHNCNPRAWGMKCEVQPGLYKEIFQAHKNAFLKNADIKANFLIITKAQLAHSMKAESLSL